MSEFADPARQDPAPLSADRARLVRLLRAQKDAGSDEIRRYPRITGRDTAQVPTSWAQQRLWFIDQLHGESAAYHIQLAVSIRGQLDETALRHALNALVQRHEVLRTVFVNVHDDCRQEISSKGHFSLKTIDLQAHAKAAQSKQVQMHKTEEGQQKFDLHTGPLIRGRLLRLASEEHALLITMHHIISDGWSMGVFSRELANLYGAFHEGRADPFDALTLQYGDYAAWQREWLQGAALEEQMNYWRAQLKDSAPQLDLPTDRPRPTAQSYRGDTIPVSFGSPLTAKLKVLARHHDMTLSMILFSGWAILLSRLSGQDDVLIGAPVANRQRSELEQLIGLFVNTLVLRFRVDGDLPVHAFLEQVKRVALGAYDHQNVPFEKIVEVLQPERSLARNPLFQVMLAFQNTPTNNLFLPGLTVTQHDVVEETAKFDLLLSLAEDGQEIVGSLNYATDLFDQRTIERWIASLEVLFDEMPASTARRLCDLPILPTNERQLIIESFNATHTAFPREQLIHQLFESQVQRTPTAIAAIYEGQALTYAELNCKANQLARHLRQAGIGADQLVALCVERSTEMLIGLLGVLKSGGAYIPMDPAYPVERLQYMLEDAAPQVLLTQEALLTKFPGTTATVVAIDRDWNSIAEHRKENLDSKALQISPRNLAYVIYTSGSTGLPKGVMVEHSGVVNFLTSMRSSPGISDEDCLLSVTTVSFDIAALEIYLPLLSGARIVLASRQAASDPRTLMTMVDKSEITILQATPATWQMLVDAGWRGRKNLKALCGGEELAKALSGKLVSRVASLWNLYGPTETTIWSCCREIRAACDEHSSVESIGRPIANTRIYILDDHRQPVPIGVAGEIYIGGVGVARGYLGRPELTAQRFLVDPFSADPQARMYKTGDLGRWRLDKAIDYLGRNDHQVKIRGFRLELGEIEAHLSRHAQVKDVVVVARKEAHGEMRLVAYVMSKNPSGVKAEELRAHLGASLPEYALPSAFVTLDRFPRTPNGKLDRRALPAPELEAYASKQYAAPQGEIEGIVATIWQELLSVRQVGRYDNFFELGGHSLLATRMISRIGERLKVVLPVRFLFNAPTVKELAALLETERHAQDANEALWMSTLAEDLQRDIDEMHDAEVLAELAQLKQDLSNDTTGG